MQWHQFFTKEIWRTLKQDVRGTSRISHDIVPEVH